MDDERNENVEENEETNEENENVENENENADEVLEEDNKYEDYANTDVIEMLRSIEKRIDDFDGAINSIKDTVAMFVENGATITDYDASNSGDDVVDDGFAEEFVDIDDLDLSI